MAWEDDALAGSIEHPGVKSNPKRKKPIEKKTCIPMKPFDSPAIGTGSKKMDPASPAMSTRSKRRLSL